MSQEKPLPNLRTQDKKITRKYENNNNERQELIFKKKEFLGKGNSYQIQLIKLT